MNGLVRNLSNLLHSAGYRVARRAGNISGPSMVVCRRRDCLQSCNNGPLIRKAHHAVVLASFLVYKSSQAVSRSGVLRSSRTKTHELGLEASGEGISYPDRVHTVSQQGICGNLSCLGALSHADGAVHCCKGRVFASKASHWQPKRLMSSHQVRLSELDASCMGLLSPPHRLIGMNDATTKRLVVASRSCVLHYARMSSSPCPGVVSKSQ